MVGSLLAGSAGAGPIAGVSKALDEDEVPESELGRSNEDNDDEAVFNLRFFGTRFRLTKALLDMAYSEGNKLKVRMNSSMSMLHERQHRSIGGKCDEGLTGLMDEVPKRERQAPAPPC